MAKHKHTVAPLTDEEILALRGLLKRFPSDPPVTPAEDQGGGGQTGGGGGGGHVP